jgi:hypothetical protein
MANYLDFLVALDDHLRDGNLGYVMEGSEMFAISELAGLTQRGDETPAQWVGLLTRDRYIAHSEPGFGDVGPIPNGAYTSYDLARFRDYRVTPTGGEAADRIRRQRREDLTDVTLGTTGADLLRVIPDERHRAAITHSYAALRSALDGERHAAAIGAAKDLVETACKITIQQAGQHLDSSPKLPNLYRQAVEAAGHTDASSDLGRRIASVVQGLAEVRNTSGAAHGQAEPPTATGRDARLAAAAACGLALHLLGPGAAA